jgi:hypothetical protein
MTHLEGSSFHLELPAGWQLVRAPLGWITGAPAAEIAREHGNVQFLRVAFGVLRHPRDAMVSVMWKRTHVVLEKLEPESTDVGGRKATLVCWTDGIHDEASWFVEDQDELLEFCCTGPGLGDPNGQIDPAEREPLALGRRILQSLSWTRNGVP